MKKNIKKPVIYVLLFVIVLFHYSNYIDSLKMTPWVYHNKKNKVIAYIKHFSEFSIYSMLFQNHLKRNDADLLSDSYNKNDEKDQLLTFRPIENLAADKSIIIFGSTNAFGMGLSEDDTFSARLGNLLPEYRIYNRAKLDWTASSMLYQLEHKTFSEIPNVKCVIYIFEIFDIYNNIDSTASLIAPYYNLGKNNKLYFQKCSLKYIDVPILKSIRRVRDPHAILIYKATANPNNYRARLIKAIIKLSKRFAEYRFPGTKFVVLRYDRGKEEAYDWMFEDLKKEGIMVVTYEELLKKKIYSLNPHRTNPKVWNDLAPALVKYLQDKNCLKD